MPYLVKLIVSALLIVLVSGIAKRSSLLGALLASVPLVSVLAMVWLYLETRDSERIAAFAQDVFWLVLPSLALFLVLPWLLRAGVQFFVALGLGLVLTALAYAVILMLQKKLTTP